MKKPLILIVGILAAICMTACGSKNSDLGQNIRNDDGAAAIQAEIDRIENDQNMPPQAKQAALGQLRARQQAGAKMSEAMQKGDEQKK
jgi:hypothetical protein